MSDKLYLGVSREDITPSVGCRLYGYEDNVFSESVHDRLSATAFVFQSGSVKAVMISATICLVHTALSERIRSRIAQELAIPPENCLLCATHTHSGPNTSGTVGWGSVDEEYCEQIFVPRVCKAAREAAQNMQHVKMGLGVGKSHVGINRRELRSDNVVYLGQNPWGPYDPNMTILSFQNDEGQIVANMIHYGCHGTAAGKNHEISRDWSGIMTDRVEGLSGGITAFFNGPEGDVGPRLTNGKTTGDITYVEELGGVAAEDAVEIFKKILVWRDVRLSCKGAMIHVPMKERISKEEAAEQLRKYENKSINLGGARKAYYEAVLASYENGYEDLKYTDVCQSILRIGDVAFVSFPYELFSEIGMRIRGASKIPYTLSLSNTNGSAGYFVTEDQICRGGYEVGMWKIACLQEYADNADWYAMQDTVKNLEDM